jgi:hypothetical protein
MLYNTPLAWLNSDRNYAEGLQLLKTLQPGSLTVLILEAGDDEYNQNLLIDEINKYEENKIVQTINDGGAVMGQPAQTNSNIQHDLRVDLLIQTLDLGEDTYLNDSLEASAHVLTALGLRPELAGITTPRNAAADTEKRLTLKKQAGQLWQEMAHTKGSMALLRGGKALHRQARSLLLLNEKRQRIWDEVDFFDENGYWHGEKTVAVDKPVNLEQLIKNQMTYRTKAEKELARPQVKSKREYLEGRVAKFNAEIDRLRSLREVTA